MLDWKLRKGGNHGQENLNKPEVSGQRNVYKSQHSPARAREVGRYIYIELAIIASENLTKLNIQQGGVPKCYSGVIGVGGSYPTDSKTLVMYLTKKS